MPNKPSITFTEAEVRLAFVVALAMGRTIDEITAKIITVTANNRTETDKATGAQKPVDGTSKLAIALDTLKRSGYVTAAR